MNIQCRSCGEQLDVGNEKRAVVAACLSGQPMKSGGRAIWTGPLEHWGSPATRFDFGDPRDPSHIVQTSPKGVEPGEAA